MAATGCKNVNSNEKASSQEESISVRLTTVKRGSLDTSLTYTGSAMPWDQLILSFKSSGRIKKLTFQEGDLVKKGQFLGSLKEIDYWLQRKLAAINVKTLKPDYERVKKLASQNALPGAEKDRMEGRYKAAKTQLLQAESMLSGTHLRSPMAGIVIKKMVTVGDMVSPARPVGVIVNLSKLKVVVVVPEMELKYFKRGMPVTVLVEALGKSLPGKVHRIAYAADKKTRGYPVTIAIKNICEDELPLIRAGMLTSVKVPRTPARGIFLPFSSVMTDLNKHSYVFLNENGRAKKRLVTCGDIVRNMVRIDKGLNQGDKVITEGQQYLREGVLLRIQQPHFKDILSKRSRKRDRTTEQASTPEQSPGGKKIVPNISQNKRRLPKASPPSGKTTRKLVPPDKRK